MEPRRKSPPHSEVFISHLNKEFLTTDLEKILEAYNLMLEVHSDQEPRADGAPYTEHPLSVALEVLDSMRDMDPDLVIAALLHDSLEDQSAKLANKLDPNITGSESERALLYLESQFGKRVARIISSLSNPDFDLLLGLRGISRGDTNYQEELNTIYAEHVKEAIQDPDVALIKYFDFAANSQHLDSVINPGRRSRLIAKYHPINRFFIDRLESNQRPLNLKDSKREEILNTLQIATQKYF
jgi:(p)ppGpp synthase/HD superfamily hydrolase